MVKSLVVPVPFIEALGFLWGVGDSCGRALLFEPNNAHTRRRTTCEVMTAWESWEPKSRFSPKPVLEFKVHPHGETGMLFLFKLFSAATQDSFSFAMLIDAECAVTIQEELQEEKPDA